MGADLSCTLWAKNHRVFTLASGLQGSGWELVDKSARSEDFEADS